jgi:hypothetical protein
MGSEQGVWEQPGSLPGHAGLASRGRGRFKRKRHDPSLASLNLALLDPLIEILTIQKQATIGTDCRQLAAGDHMLHGFYAATQAANSRGRSAQGRAAINSVKAFRVIASWPGPFELHRGCCSELLARFVISRNGAGTDVIHPTMQSEITLFQSRRNRRM